MEQGDFVLYKVMIDDDDSPRMIVGRSLEDISRDCHEWCGLIKSAEWVMDIHFITRAAMKYAESGKD